MQAIGLAVFIGLLAGAPARGQTSPPTILRVLITPMGIQLSHATVKAGPVRVLVVNRTQMDDPHIEIRVKATGALAAGCLPGAGRKAKTWHNATLQPGVHTVGVAGMQGLVTEVLIEP